MKGLRNFLVGWFLGVMILTSFVVAGIAIASLFTNFGIPMMMTGGWHVFSAIVVAITSVGGGLFWLQELMEPAHRY